MNNSCSQIQPLLASYALEALEVGKRIQVEQHLPGCPECQQALADYQAVGDALLASIPPAQPRAVLRTRLLYAISPPPQKPVKGRVSWLDFQHYLLPALALAGVIVLALVNINLNRSMRLLVDQQKQQVRQLQSYQTALSLVVSQEARVAELEGEGINGSLIFNPEGSTAVLNITGLDDLPAEQTYQVWLIRPDDSRESGGTFNSQDGISTLVIQTPENLDSFWSLGVTIEPAGGSPGPTGPRVLAGKL